MSEAPSAGEAKAVFVTGGTGYIGRALITALLARGHAVRALVRAASRDRLPRGADPVIGDALEADSFATALRPHEVVVHLVGTPHPNPRKAAEFLRVDLASILATVRATRGAGITHVVYLSVAQPAPVMQAYIAARAQGEKALADAGFARSILRPWYVLGEGHRWPVLLKPLYALAEIFPQTRDTARRMGLVTLAQMVAALVHAVETPPGDGTLRIIDVPEIRRLAASSILLLPKPAGENR
jgi:uncharacterized protein YbjT (DUF2867 family)